jgi:hypothetical protein
LLIENKSFSTLLATGIMRGVSARFGWPENGEALERR